MNKIVWKYVKPLINASLATDFWKKYNVQLPTSLEHCLISNNGGRPSVFLFDTNLRKEYVFQSLFSYNAMDKCNIYNVYPGEFKNTSLFPIGIEASGNIVCYDMDIKKYVLWNHENGRREEIIEVYDG